MSTRSRIGIHEDESVRSIYCHFDGYPDGVGHMLTTHYRDPEKVARLLSLGDISCLGADLVASDLDDGTVAYGRDKHEEGCEATVHSTADWPASGQEYEYLGRAVGDEVVWETREVQS